MLKVRNDVNEKGGGTAEKYHKLLIFNFDNWWTFTQSSLLVHRAVRLSLALFYYKGCYQTKDIFGIRTEL